jgi:hypothetical protein
MTQWDDLGAAMEADSMQVLGALDPNILQALQSNRSINPSTMLLKNPAALQQAIASMRSRISQHGAPVGVRKMTAAATIMARTLAQIEAHRRHESKLRPTVVVGVNFDSVAATTASATATIGTPYQGQDFAITGFLAYGSAIQNFRLIQFNPGGVDLVSGTTTSAVKGLSVTNPGVPLFLWSQDFLARMHPRFNWSPWTGRAMVFSSESTFNLQVYNAGASGGTAQIAIFMQCSPCGSNTKFKMMRLMEKHIRAWDQAYLGGRE